MMSRPKSKKLFKRKKIIFNKKVSDKHRIFDQKRIANIACDTCAGKHWRYLERY